MLYIEQVLEFRDTSGHIKTHTRTLVIVCICSVYLYAAITFILLLVSLT